MGMHHNSRPFGHHNEPPAGVATKDLLHVAQQGQGGVDGQVVGAVVLPDDREPVDQPPSHHQAATTEVKQVGQEVLQGVGDLLRVVTGEILLWYGLLAVVLFNPHPDGSLSDPVPDNILIYHSNIW